VLFTIYQVGVCPLIKLKGGLQLLHEAKDNICNWLDTKATKALMKQNKVALKNVTSKLLQSSKKSPSLQKGTMHNVRITIFLKTLFQFFSSANLVNGWHDSTMCLADIMIDHCIMTILHFTIDRLILQIQSEDTTSMALIGFSDMTRFQKNLVMQWHQ